MPITALMVIVASLIALQLGFWVLDWEEIRLPDKANDEVLEVWPPEAVLERRLGDIPVTGSPFLFALPFCMLLALVYLRDKNRRAVGTTLGFSFCFGLLFILLQILFVQEASFDFSGNILGAEVFMAMGYFAFVVGFGVVLQMANLLMLCLRSPDSAVKMILVLNLLYWAAVSLSWTSVLFQIAG